ncbi:dTDP-4-dehydrorhamnose 3,5-epimerase family protein [Amycolatopsis sp. NPDC059090]|uniref:dTDP-4-dehydrorhamnose 3,5-epimerase family protein n=1 Tax=unclassified Amycolatopsis TaxID=2618356 RepID=UPI003672DBC4
MRFRPLAVPGAYSIEPDSLRDDRGRFYEAYRTSEFAEAIGHSFRPAQINYSVSRRNVLRGIHGTLLPPGQEKVVTCHRGALLDVVVDLRLGSPTFGVSDSTVLDAESGRSVYLADGLGHAFVALADDTCVGYLCSTEFVPGTQLDVNPFDSDLALPWRLPGGGLVDNPVVSEKDAGSPSLKEAIDAGLLPAYEDCVAWSARLRAGVQAKTRATSIT